MLQIGQITLRYDEPLDQVPQRIAKKLRISPDGILSFNVVRLSVDARKKPNVVKVCTVNFEAADEKNLLKRHRFLKQVEPEPERSVATPNGIALAHRPVVVGSGPSGIFAAYVLAEQGYRPLIIERGEPIEQRVKSVTTFWETGHLDPESNVQFGEGGAGTFSDGKLTTRIKDRRIGKVLETFVRHGARPEILYLNKPHIGTDILRRVMIDMRLRIREMGGEFRFNTRLTGLRIDAGCLSGIEINGREIIPADVAVLGIGNAARDTFGILHDLGVRMEAKPFAVGFRIEHPQAMIDAVQYGRAEIARHLGAADYHLTHRAENGRSVYTFCMCPGGQVIAGASEPGHLVVNGMSEFARNRPNANSAVIVGVSPEDFPSSHPLAGMEFQRAIEAKAFEMGGGDYFAPVQSVGGFLSGQIDQMPYREVQPSHRPGVRPGDLGALYPEPITEALREAVVAFGRKLEGFDISQAILTGVETRSSSPVRIVRDEETRESVTVRGLYPVGEGAGYAGGITSSAVDGVRTAEVVIDNYLNIANI